MLQIRYIVTLWLCLNTLSLSEFKLCICGVVELTGKLERPLSVGNSNNAFITYDCNALDFFVLFIFITDFFLKKAKAMHYNI
ncbi:hypothetical protein T4D_15944 [Trichinella pseudospiralis]|uniref:Uncharacterized protein n=1 Tax=Trichinella pseudospiralis TaxID=6337 RepID=A0A0V1FLN1_TRIPS|nr:hypothetical protein T4D_15944 [Trichinella pseudospiralis]